MTRIGPVRVERSVRHEPVLSDPCNPERCQKVRAHRAWSSIAPRRDPSNLLIRQIRFPLSVGVAVTATRTPAECGR